jgi:hypothetical protein
VISGGGKTGKESHIWDGNSLFSIAKPMSEIHVNHCSVYGGEHVYVISGDNTAAVERIRINDRVEDLQWESVAPLNT